VGPDEAYLYKIADKIIPTDANRNLVKVSQLGPSALLTSSASSGIIWCQQNCNIGSGNQVGTPNAPVILILDGPVTHPGHRVRIRVHPRHGHHPAAANGQQPAGNCPNNCMLTFNAGSAIYGALVVQGQIKSNGTSAVIYDGNVLQSIIDQAPPIYATLPGAWNDRRSY
jgi:hypothetical protein